MLLIASMAYPVRESGGEMLAARPFTRSGLRGVGREVLLDQRAIALEPILHLHELAALARPDLPPAAMMSESALPQTKATTLLSGKPLPLSSLMETDGERPNRWVMM